MNYTQKDIGCYVDGAWGIYVSERVIHFANEHGANLTVTLADAQFVFEMEDEATIYMNDKFGVEGAYWGRNEQGDWGLWLEEEAAA